MNNNSIDKLDIINKGIAAKRLAEYKQTEGIRVGDYLKLPNGRYTRFTYDWEDGTIQAGGHSQSQYELYSKGHMAYSGSLEPSIDKNSLQLTPETKVGYMRYEGKFTGEEGLKSCGLQVVQRVFEVKPGAKISHFYDNPEKFEKLSADGSKFKNGGSVDTDELGHREVKLLEELRNYKAELADAKTVDEQKTLKEIIADVLEELDDVREKLNSFKDGSKFEKGRKINYKKITTAKVDAFTEQGDEGELVVRIDDITIPTRDRQKGIGKTEVNGIIEWAKSINADHIVIEAKRSSIPFWEKLGFDILDQGSTVSTGILKLNQFKNGGTISYMGNKGDQVVIEKIGWEPFIKYTLTNAKTFSMIDMQFSSEEEAKKYATKRGVIIRDKFNDDAKSLELNTTERFIIIEVYRSRIKGLRGQISYFETGDTRWHDENVRTPHGQEIENIKKEIEHIDENVKFLYSENYPFEMTSAFDARKFLSNLNNLPKTSAGRELFNNHMYGDVYYDTYIKLYDKLDKFAEAKYGESYSFKKGGSVDDERKTKAIKAYYADRPQLKTLDEARKKGKRFGNWIIKVNLPDGSEFYTMTTFHEKWVYPGAVYGMWNELTLIEKAGSSMAKGGTIDTDTALLPEVIAYYLAESVILEKWKGKLTKENDAAIQKEIKDWQDYLTKRAEYLYKNNEGFKKKVKARGDNGLHYLNMMMAHWMGVQDERIGGSYGAKTDLAGAEKAKKRWLDSVKPQKKMEQGGEIEKVSGIFYRVDTGFTPPRGTTALDVVNFEADELDNEDSKIGRDKMKAAGIDLSKYSWKDITWVTKTKKHATRYGSARNVQQVEIKNGVIVSEDGDEGYLILELGKSGINMEDESKKWQERKKLGYILPEPIAVFQEKTDKGTNIGAKIRYYDVGERDWWYQLVGESYKPTEKPVYGKAGHWVSRKQYPTVKSLEKYHQHDNIFLVQDGDEQQSSEPLLYSEWSKKFLADFRANHPNSTAPSNHVMSHIYDDYVGGFKMKQGGEILTWKDHQRHDYNASHLNVQPIPAGDKAKTYGKFNVDAIYLKGNPIPAGCLSSSFSDQVGELMRSADYVNNSANTKKVLDRFKKWAVDEYVFDKSGRYKRKELGLTPQKKFNISTDELNKFIAQINSLESLDDITYSVERQKYEQGGNLPEHKKITFKGDNTPYFVIKDQGDTVRVVIDEKYDIWKKATPIERYEYYEEVIPKSEFNEFTLTDSEALDFVINVLTERKNLVVPELVPPYKVITPKMIEDYKQAHVLMDAMLMKAHTENNEALVKKLQNLEFITWTLKAEQGAIRMNDLLSLGDYIAEAKALKSENFKQGGVVGKHKTLKSASQELTSDDKLYISIYSKLNAHAKTVAKKHGIPASSLYEYMQTRQYLMGDDAEIILDRAHALGVAANQQGLMRVPFHDAALTALLEKRENNSEMGSAIPYYDAWTKGFDSENRRAAFAVLDKPENVEMNKKFRNDFLKNRKKLTQ